MSTKFDAVTIEEDTKVLFQTTANFGEYEVLYQKWRWEGITAESIIFVTDDIAEIGDENLLEEIKASPLVQGDSQVTVSRSDAGYTFFNFNFVS